MIDLAIVLPNYIEGKLGGTQTFVDELVLRLSKRSDMRITVYCQKGQEHNFKLVETIACFVESKNKLTSLAAILQTSTPAFRRKLNQHDLAFYPLQAAFGVKSINIPTLVTIHDVQHLDLPKLFSFAERVYRKYAYDLQASRFTHISTDSDFSRNRIAETLDIATENISTILIGTRNIGMDPLVSREDFLIYPARGWPHKNHKNLFEAIRRAADGTSNIKLYLTGEPPMIPSDLKHLVFDLGRVKQSDLDNLYRKARALIFPSLYEGFGLPPIEAMSAGCPVFVSNAGSLPEVCSDAAYYFDPNDINSIYDAILATESPSPFLADRGLLRSSQLSWETTAEMYSSLMHDLVKR